jgi:hypothetical protein
VGSCRLGCTGRWCRGLVVATHAQPSVRSAFRPWPARGPVPRSGRPQFHGLISADRAAGGQHEGEGAGDLEHVSDATVLAERPQAQIAAVDLLGGDPGRQHPGGVHLGPQVDPELGLGLEHPVLAPPARAHRSGSVVHSGGRSRRGVDMGVAPGASVGAGPDGDRGGDLPGAAPRLAGDPRRGGALRGLPGLVPDSDRVQIGEVLDREVAHDAHGLVFVPHGMVEQPLHLVRGAVPRPLGQRPAVLAGNIAQEALGGTSPPATAAPDRRTPGPAGPATPPGGLAPPRQPLSSPTRPSRIFLDPQSRRITRRPPSPPYLPARHTEDVTHFTPGINPVIPRHPASPSITTPRSGHEVRLPYWPARTACSGAGAGPGRLAGQVLIVWT